MIDIIISNQLIIIMIDIFLEIIIFIIITVGFLNPRYGAYMPEICHKIEQSPCLMRSNV